MGFYSFRTVQELGVDTCVVSGEFRYTCTTDPRMSPLLALINYAPSIFMFSILSAVPLLEFEWVIVL